MSVERQRKIEILARKNLARRKHPYYLTEISHVLKHAVTENDRLDLEMTDQLFSRFDNGTCYKDPAFSLKSRWPLGPDNRWLRICCCLAEQIGAERVALFAGPYRTCGAVQTEARYPLINAVAVLEFDRDTVRLQSLDSDTGLYLDWYDENDIRWIELKVWGKWCSWAQKCLRQAEDPGENRCS